jgi:hypothetical protein
MPLYENEKSTNEGGVGSSEGFGACRVFSIIMNCSRSSGSAMGAAAPVSLALFWKLGALCIWKLLGAWPEDIVSHAVRVAIKGAAVPPL